MANPTVHPVIYTILVLPGVGNKFDNRHPAAFGRIEECYKSFKIPLKFKYGVHILAFNSTGFNLTFYWSDFLRI